MAMEAVKIAEFKSKLSAYLRRVRKGQSLLVTDRDTPVARVVPVEENERRLLVDEARADPASLARLRYPPLSGVDSLALLLEERGER